MTRHGQLPYVRAVLAAVTTYNSTLNIDHTHWIKVFVPVTMTDDVLTSGQFYGVLQTHTMLQSSVISRTSWPLSARNSTSFGLLISPSHATVRNFPGSPYLVCEDLHVFIGYTPNPTVVGCSRFVLLNNVNIITTLLLSSAAVKNSLGENVITKKTNIISITSIKTHFLTSKPKH